MLKLFSLILLSTAVFSQVTFPTGTSSSFSTTANSVTTVAGTVRDGGNGYWITMSANGWVVSSAMGLTAAASPTAVTVYTTLLGNIGGGYVGIGVAQVSGQGVATTACPSFYTKYQTTTPSASVAGQSAKATAVCMADFITIYTSAPAAATAETKTTPALVAGTPVKWVFTPPVSGAFASASTACVKTEITPQVASPTTTTLNYASNANTCSSGVAQDFSLQAESAANTAIAGGAAAFGMYVELGGVAANTQALAIVCVQTSAQYGIAPGNCFASILSGVLASFGLIVAIFFN